MAESYILNIKPTITASEGKKLENDLNKRFARVASKFGGALRNSASALKGVLAGTFSKAFNIASGALKGALASAMAVIVSNPIDKLNNAIDNALNRADTLATRAGQIGTTSGRLLQVQAVAESAGVQNFDMIISRFQTELQKSRTGESDLLKEFAGENDTLEAFLQVIDSIKQLKPAEQNLMISKIFGERANLQLAEFMQADLIDRKKQIFGDRSSEELTRAIDALGEKEDLQSILRQRTAVEDLLTKSRTITEGTIRLQNAYEKSKLNLENTQFGSYGDFAKMAISMEEAKQTLSQIQADLTPLVTKGVELAEEGVGYVKDGFDYVKNSRFGKWVGGVFK